MKNLFFFTLPFIFISCETLLKQSIIQSSSKSSEILFAHTDHLSLPYLDSFYETFRILVSKITYLIKKYFIAFLNEEPIINYHPKATVVDKIQVAKLAHTGKLTNKNQTCVISSFKQETERDIQLIIEFGVPNKEKAERLAPIDSTLKSRHLMIKNILGG